MSQDRVAWVNVIRQDAPFICRQVMTGCDSKRDAPGMSGGDRATGLRAIRAISWRATGSWAFGLPWIAAPLCLGLLSLGVAGCGSDMPFDVVPVQGKVSYDDGSLITAQSIQINFNPATPETKGKMVSPGGQTRVNVSDGTFSNVTSRRPGDGVVIGRHKVVVVAFEEGRNGFPAPSRAVPQIYHRVETTPIEVDVTSPNQFIEIKVSKNG